MDEQSQAAFVSWHLRSDVEIHPAGYDGESWIIKDPLKLNYFQVGREERTFLQNLDGKTSWDVLASKMQAEYPEAEFSADNLRVFLASGIKSGILIPGGVGYGTVLATMSQAERRSAWTRKIFSLISHRFRGFDPTALLRVLDRLLGWIFQRWVLTLASAFVAVAAVMVLARVAALRTELPTIAELFTPSNLLLMSVAVAGIKILHEFGHALTCHHFGGECHEIGCIVIGVLPLLYCDVSDSWLQQQRLRRALVSAAGIGVELVLAAIFALLWAFSVPGLLHSFFLNITLLCSLNTVMVNGNPLLRYDGYYVLSDLLQIPNLGPESRRMAIAKLDRIILGPSISVPDSGSPWRNVWMPIYGAASVVYRWVVLASILLLIHTALKPYRLEAISYFLAITMLAGIALSGFRFFRQRLSVVKTQGAWNYRASLGLGLSALITVAVTTVPLPFSTTAPATLTPGNAAPVYVQTPGHVDSRNRYGTEVNAGQAVAELQNHDVDLQVTRLEGELASAEARIRFLTGTRQVSDVTAAALPAARKAVDNIRSRLQTVREKADRLLLRSPRTGVMFPPRSQPKPQLEHIDQQFWHGTPLDPRNVSTWLEEQTLVAVIGDKSDFRLVAYVRQQDIEFIRRNSQVRIRFESQPSEIALGTVGTITTSPEKMVPPEIALKQLVPANAKGMPNATVFAVQIQLEPDDESRLPPLYSTGMASIQCDDKSLLDRLRRLLSHTFAFEI